jgi:hypothetical protein
MYINSDLRSCPLESTLILYSYLLHVLQLLTGDLASLNDWSELASPNKFYQSLTHTLVE